VSQLVHATCLRVGAEAREHQAAEQHEQRRAGGAEHRELIGNVDADAG
jgi:hypothetical protein